jgi:hypothetical protein
MKRRTALHRMLASSLMLLLLSCRSTGSKPLGAPGAAELSRSVLVIQEAPSGQMSHAWQPLGDFDLSRSPSLASTHHLEGAVVRASFNRDCEAELESCEEMCRAALKGRSWSHASAGSKNAICRERCRPAYLDCCKLKELSEAVKPRVSFPAVDGAVDWLKRNHREVLVGTVVIIAGVTFVVVVAGTGGAALVLVPAVLLASTRAPSASPLAQVEP